ncbi:hypothetical protein [Salipiger sp.]|uniref:hypothetical protein n=1 Tax=Salipiger sp. TaxID=2078585 RepID=UPI003A970CBC
MRLLDVFLQYGRALEWMTSAIIFVFACTLALPGDTLAASRSFSSFRDVGLTEENLILAFTLIAVMRFAGLWINGSWRRSPVLRMTGAALGAGIFWALAALFAAPYLSGVQGALTSGVGTYAVLGAADAWAAYRAAADVPRYRRDRVF